MSNGIEVLKAHECLSWKFMKQRKIKMRYDIMGTTTRQQYKVPEKKNPVPIHVNLSNFVLTNCKPT